jgi:serine/threonine protein kinase
MNKTSYDPRLADIWSLGVLTYRLLFGVAPFKRNSNETIEVVVQRGTF